MINKLTRYAACLLTIISLGLMTACEKENNNAIPSIEISDVITTTESLSFMLAPQDATSYAYAVATSEEHKNNSYTLINVQENTQKRQKVTGLANNTKYIIIAVAYNGSIVSEVKTFVTRTKTEAPTIDDVQITASSNEATIVVKASEGTTKLVYTIYTKATADMYAQMEQETGIPDDGSWKNWVEHPVTDPQNITIVSKDMPSDVYIFEAVAIATLMQGKEFVTKMFSIMVQDRPYVRISLLGQTFGDVNVAIEKNSQAKKYYVGLSHVDDLDLDKLFAELKTTEGTKYLKTDDYEGSLHALVGNTFTGKWMPEDTMVAWTIGCKEDGSFVADIKNLNKIMFKIPSPTYNGTGSVSAEINAFEYTSYKATLTATNCTKFYYLAGVKSELDFEFSNKKDLIESGVLAETPVTAVDQPLVIEKSNLSPNTEYVIYAIGMDSKGELGELMTQVITTKSVSFNSKANLTVEVTKLEPINVSLAITPNAECVSMRYIIITNKVFVDSYNGSLNRVLSDIALNAIPGGSTLHTFATDGKQIDLKNISSNTFYLFFAVPMDKDGAMGRIEKETAIKTPKFDVTGTATVTISNLRKAGSSITCNITPNASCQGYYLLPLLSSQGTVTNKLIETILTTTANRTYKYGEGGEPAPAMRNYKQAIIPEQNIYILCRDMEGKYNDPMKYYINADGKLVIDGVVQ